MATGGEARQKGVAELKQEVTCPACQDHFQEPKILPCLHHYCKGCIQALVRRAGGPNQPFPCPECRTTTVLPPQGDPDHLPTAFFVNRMKEAHAKLEKVQGKAEAKCEMCSGGVATAYCRQCAEFIYEKCKESHEQMKVFAGHKVLTLEELKEGGAKEIVAAKSTPPPVCKVHEEQAKIYCYDCKSLICQDCVIKDHREHEYKFVKKAAPETKKKLMEHLVPLSEIQMTVRNAVKDTEGAKAEIIGMDESMTASIKRSFQGLRDVLDKREKETLVETAAIVEEKMNNLNVQQKKLEMSLGTIQSLVEFVERSIENATDEELMSIQTQMMTRITEETEKQRQTNAKLDPVEEADREVDFECAEEIKKLCQLKVRVAITPVNIAVETTEAVVGQQSKLDIRLTFQNGRPVMNTQNVKAILTSKVDGSHVPTKVIRKQQNTYQIEFTPTVRDRHQLELMYKGTAVSREPVQISVKIPPTMLGKPVRKIDVTNVEFVAFNSSEEMLVTADEEIIAFDKGGKKLYSIANERLVDPVGIAVDGSSIYIVDRRNHCLLKFDETGKLLKSVGKYGRGNGLFDSPTGLTVVGDEVFVCDLDRLQVFTSDLVYVRQFGSLSGAIDVTHDEDGNLYVTEYGNDRVQVFNTQGKFLRTLVAQGHITEPNWIATDGELVFITQEKENGEFYTYHKNGEQVCSFAVGMTVLEGVAVDQDGFIYVCDYSNDIIIIF